MLRGIHIDNEIPLSKKFNNYLFTVGINKYQGFPELYNAVKDIDDFSSLLFQKYEFDEDNHISLTNEEATEQKIVDNFKFLINRITPEDSLIIYFSGHGHFDETLDLGYWIPVDAVQGQVNTFISNLDIANFLKRLKAHHILLIADSCFSGALISGKRSSAAIKKAESYPSCRVFTSGRNEVVEDGSKGQNSPFAQSVLKILRENKDMYLSCTDFIEGSKKIVNAQLKQQAIDGRLKESGDDNGEFVFWTKSSEQTIWEEQIDKSNVDSLKQYINIYTEGKYTDEAIKLIRDLEEDKVWEKAQREKSSQRYYQYIAQYPEGRYREKAEEFIQKAKAREEERKKRAAALVEHRNKIESARKNYSDSIQKAEKFYKDQEYKKARKYYWEGLSKYFIEHEGFIPKRADVEKKIGKCEKAILFYEYMQDGKEAISKELYPLALDYLNKAKQIKNTEQVQNLIEACQKGINKTKGGRLTEDIKRRKKITIRTKERDTPSPQPKVVLRSPDPTPKVSPPQKVNRPKANNSRPKPQPKPQPRQQPYRPVKSGKNYGGIIIALVLITLVVIFILARQNNSPRRPGRTSTTTQPSTNNNTSSSNTARTKKLGVVTASSMMLRDAPSTLTTESRSRVRVIKGTQVEILDKVRGKENSKALQCATRMKLFFEDQPDEFDWFNRGKAVTLIKEQNETYSLVELEYNKGQLKRGFMETINLKPIGTYNWYKVKYAGKEYYAIEKYIEEK